MEENREQNIATGNTGEQGGNDIQTLLFSYTIPRYNKFQLYIINKIFLL